MLASETDRRWRIGYVSGAFDMFHIGHLNLLRRSRERCDYLVAGVLTDEVVLRCKKKWPVIPLKERMEIIASLKCVDEVDRTTLPLLDKVAAWHKYHFDAMFSGDDHLHDGWAREEEDLAMLGAELVFFPYTKEVTTTKLRIETLPPMAESGKRARSPIKISHLFPFDRVGRGERIVIYGAGRVGKQYAYQLGALKYCELLAFADSYAKAGDMFMGKDCLTPDELADIINQIDRIVVASTTYHAQILDCLRALRIEPEKIV